MTKGYAIKKLQREGYNVTQDKGRITAKKENQRHYIELLVNGKDVGDKSDIAIIDLRREGQDDDIMTDYHAGTFCDNLAQALSIAN